jgi:Fic family protein
VRSFRSDYLSSLNIPGSTAWLVGACMEAKGKQDLWLRQKPEVLKALRELAIIQSVESSNRIEGVTVAPDRLRPVVLGEVDPRERPEEELLGYRRALDLVHTRYEHIEVTPANIRRLHELCQGGFSGDAGQWKQRNNEIVEILANGERRVRFVPLPPEETPDAMEQLCLAYRDTDLQEMHPSLVTMGILVFDFLCVHPFRDGNGRVARLLALLALRRHGFHVGSYISLERIIEETKETYYESLHRSSQGWHHGKHDLIPWINYFLSTVRLAYGEFEKRFESVKASGGKSELVRQTIARQTGPFSLSDIRSQCPSVSPQAIKKVLKKLREEGRVRLSGKGRGARWHLEE